MLTGRRFRAYQRSPQRTAGLLTILLMGVAAAGCQGEGAPRVTAKLPEEQRSTLGPIPVGSPVVTSVAGVCLDVPGAAQIDSVTLLDAVAIELVDFAVTPRGQGGVGDQGTLDTIDAGHERAVVSLCSDDLDMINVVVRRTQSGAEGGYLGYEVTWSNSSGARGSFESPVGLTLCDDDCDSLSR